MKVAVSASGKDLASQVEPRFGRCSQYIIVDTETMAFDVVPNTAVGAAHGAGVQGAQLVASKGVRVVLTGNVGPNAFSALLASSIQVISGVSGTVGDAVELYKKGELSATTGPTVRGHFGTGGRGGGRGMGRRRPFRA